MTQKRHVEHLKPFKRRISNHFQEESNIKPPQGNAQSLILKRNLLRGLRPNYRELVGYHPYCRKR